MPSEMLSAAAARRVALAAQGFGQRRGQVGQRSPGTRQLNLLLQRLGVLQIDSVNVFERSHYLPLFARLGAYDKALLDKLLFHHRGPYVESWAHVASLIPVDTWPLLGWRRTERMARDDDYGSWAAAHPEMIEFVLREIAEHGPRSSGQIEHEENVRAGPWWGWSDVKTALEVLWVQGRLVATQRRRFERVYDLAERALPAEVLGSDLPKPDAIRELVRISTRALGVGTVRDIADYFRLLQVDAKAAIHDLVESGELLPVTVEGWKPPAYLHRDARVPRQIESAALLSPFDPIVWERERALRMFGFDYRIEIYTPAPKRTYGYYTLPLLIDEALVGRIDLKSDRHNKTLRVQSAWREPGATVDIGRTAALLRETASWQGLDGIVVQDWGDLARDLAAELGVDAVARG